MILAIIAAIGIILEFVNQFILVEANIFSVEITLIALTIFAIITAISNLKK